MNTTSELREQIVDLCERITEMDNDNPKNWPLIARMSASITEKEKRMKTIMLPNGMMVSADDLTDILEHADIRTILLNRVLDEPRNNNLLLDIIKELGYKPGYQEEEMNGLDHISAERRRQVYDKSWTAEHDDGHTNEELADAAAFYAIPSKYGELLVFWPWAGFSHGKEDKTRITQLAIAGALIAAEIDRLLRKEND